jgi:hypothetical protein
LPLGQSTHAEASAKENVPAAQVEHTGASASEYLPPGHVSHAADIAAVSEAVWNEDIAQWVYPSHMNTTCTTVPNTQSHENVVTVSCAAQPVMSKVLLAASIVKLEPPTSAETPVTRAMPSSALDVAAPTRNRALRLFVAN